MALRDEIVPFTDGNGLVAPNLVPPGTVRGSDNGPMYTAELYAILKKLNQLTDQDKSDFAQKIGQCINPEGMLCRVPIGQDDGQEQVDDYYGVANCCKMLQNVTIPRLFLKALFKNWGFMDNEKPGSHSNWDSFMPRQLQLMAAIISAAFPSWLNPLHILIRLLCWPLYAYTAIIIFTSCIGVDPNNCDARRLSWHLVQATRPVSLLCRFASAFWYHRLYNTYGLSGMRNVAAHYYKDQHPFIRYWVS